MKTHVKRLAAIAIAGLGAAGLGATGLGGAAFGDGGSLRDEARVDRLACEISVDERPGTVALEARVMSPGPADGEYRFRVTKRGGGGANIDQSGLFHTDRGRRQRVGQITLGADGGRYDARLEITHDGETISCSERIGGWL
jgi:hypothetical protein